ncbi:co-chaperone YbbN [Demequina lutea]|uniref:Putative thioredoxin n=1 Tax=Demequina lutea TaxID=431489 RepID=A0A7Z0CIN7_9MICO|nr:tetratricopeptide repeat protein [Demequina lutea]NYI42134.1 putative thioredoxin [Demequina lutea]
MNASTPFAGAVDLASLAAKANAPATGAPGAPQTMTETNAGQFVQESQRRPVLVLLCSSLEPQCADLTARVTAIVREYGDSVLLVTVDVDIEVGLAGAFQIQAVPAMLALVAGRPVPLFQGAPDDSQIRGVFAQVVEVARQAGMDVSGAPSAEADAGHVPAEAPLPPLHQEAFEAIERDDLGGALAAYDKALKENPRDADARAGRAQVGLIARARDADPAVVRAAAADAPSDIDAQLAVADLDILGGQVEDAFARLLDVIVSTTGDDRDRARLRLVDLFEVVGPTDVRVATARKVLASALN